ncbi:MAG: helix-hairpin-helix domain-containing protein [Erythrobacter sp.]|nr:helix-hairpin-helix domain-containing protein [Erythrobacter sp.]
MSNLRGVQSSMLSSAIWTLPVGAALLAGSVWMMVRYKRPARDRVAHRDDLTDINGIGSTLAEKLKNEGVHSFDQIAAWTEADVRRIDAILMFSGRIERDEWVAQARELSANRSR